MGSMGGTSRGLRGGQLAATSTVEQSLKAWAMGHGPWNGWKHQSNNEAGAVRVDSQWVR